MIETLATYHLGYGVIHSIENASCKQPSRPWFTTCKVLIWIGLAGSGTLGILFVCNRLGSLHCCCSIGLVGLRLTRTEVAVGQLG